MLRQLARMIRGEFRYAVTSRSAYLLAPRFWPMWVRIAATRARLAR